ncbi:YdhK family protein [Brevibacterium sp. ZH18]|uniref:YdhK family protein n=1 Tax=Brevibacterium sp. ZH18 TaxID=2927784 RepID=UPI001F611ED8|nr:YdhK family protein [Brevibacterium sp. ZH18]MCI4010708.1 YdhK family protein [Brevibacterium sp. ZH18]
MNTSTLSTTIVAIAAASALVLSGCASSEGDEAAQHSQHEKQSESASSENHGESHEHAADGGQPPKGIEKASDPTYAVGDEVTLAADHMPGMKGAKATISGAFETTTYSVSYTPTDGGDPVKDHKWVVQEELKNPGKAPLKDGAKVILKADHMPGMKGAEATIDSSTEDTVYMVDIDMDGMTMTNHKWVTEDEVQPVK